MTRYDAAHVREAAHIASRVLDLSADRTAWRARVVLARLKPYSDVPQVRELLTRHPMSA